MQVSVIIPTYERCESLKRALTALSRQTFPFDDYEVIVSVDGSTDSTMEMIKGFQAPYELRTIWKPNGGRSVARNRGIEEAKGEVLIFLDDDMEALPGLIERHFERHRSKHRICVLGNIPVSISDHSPPLHIHIAETVYVPFLARLSSPNYRFQGLEFYSGNFSIRRELLLETGSFNPGYNISEDSELGIRIANAGIEVVFDPGAAAMQHIEKDFAQFAEFTVERGKSAIQFTLDYPETFYFRRVCEYNTGTRKWRFFRNALIGASLRFPRLPGLVSRLVRLMEKIIPGRMKRYYSLSLDYFYWLGVSSALEDLPDINELKSRIKSHREPRRHDFISVIRPASDT